MKRLFFILILSIVSLGASAKAPNLHVEQIFNGSYNTNPSVALTISKSQEKYFRACTITDNKDLVNKITQLYEKDLPGAVRENDFISNGSKFRTMVILNNGEEIKVGLSSDANNGCYLFINGPSNAFK